MKNIYLPIQNFDEFACYSVYDKDTIRAYYTMPQVDSSSNFVDFYINSHYIEKQGTQQWNYYASLPTCISKENITNNYYYRNDFASSLFIFTIFAIFGILIPIKIFVRLFRRFDF